MKQLLCCVVLALLCLAISAKDAPKTEEISATALLETNEQKFIGTMLAGAGAALGISAMGGNDDDDPSDADSPKVPSPNSSPFGNNGKTKSGTFPGETLYRRAVYGPRRRRMPFNSYNPDRTLNPFRQYNNYANSPNDVLFPRNPWDKVRDPSVADLARQQGFGGPAYGGYSSFRNFGVRNNVFAESFNAGVPYAAAGFPQGYNGFPQGGYPQQYTGYPVPAMSTNANTAHVGGPQQGLLSSRNGRGFFGRNPSTGGPLGVNGNNAAPVPTTTTTDATNANPTQNPTQTQNPTSTDNPTQPQQQQQQTDLY